jgi:hypothetical protein
MDDINNNEMQNNYLGNLITKAEELPRQALRYYKKEQPKKYCHCICYFLGCLFTC